MEKADRQVLKLSDSFDGESDIELKVTMININYGHNKELLDACKPLKEYSWFVAAVRENQKTMGDLEKAIDSAMNDLPEDSLIKPLLIANKAEVKRMCITEYDEERAFSEQKEEGIEIGLERGILKTLAELVRDGILTITDAAKRAGITVSEFEAKTGMNE